MRQLETELGEPIKRQVVYEGRPDLTFDGYVFAKGVPTFIEVKYVSSADRVNELIRSFLRRMQIIREFTQTPPARGIFVIVGDVLKDAQRQIEVIAHRLSGRKYGRPDVRVYAFADLMQAFGLEESD